MSNMVTIPDEFDLEVTDVTTLKSWEEGATQYWVRVSADVLDATTRAHLDGVTFYLTPEHAAEIGEWGEKLIDLYDHDGREPA